MKKNKKTINEPSLFDMKESMRQHQEDLRRDELNLALMPLAYFPGKKSKKLLYELTLPIGDGKEVRLISSKAGGGIPEGNDLDYLYALIDLLYEQSNFKDDTIYFLISELVAKADRIVSQIELQRALRAIRRYRFLVVQSNAFKIVDDSGKIKSITDDISYIQHFTIVGDELRRGRRKYGDTSQDGKCMVVFSKYFMQNIISKEMSKPLNYALMRKLSNPKGKKLFRVIDAFRYLEGYIGEDHYELVSKDLFDVARRIPLSESEMKYISHIKRSIDPIHEELKQLSYISDYFYKEIDGRIQIVYVFSKFKTDQASAFNELVARGITAKAAEELALAYDPEKIFDCLKYCDYKKEEKKISAGYLRTIIVDSNHDTIRDFLDKKRQEKKRDELKTEFKARDRMKMFYDLDIENRIGAAMEACTPSEKAALNERAAAELKKPGMPRLDDVHRELTIDSFMRKYIKDTLNIPSFEQWLEENRKKYEDLL